MLQRTPKVERTPKLERTPKSGQKLRGCGHFNNFEVFLEVKL